jgi:molybdopterin molybdotransferase
MIGVAEARMRMLTGLDVVEGVERLPLAQSLGRILEAPLVAPRDVPPAANSAMDGYALRYDELVAADGLLPVAGRIAAGDPPATLAPGTAMGILTGAIVPDGADTIVPIEACEVAGGTLPVAAQRIRRGAHIRPAGEDLARGAVALPAGRRLRPQDLGVAASLGLTDLSVRRRLRAAVVATGDELVAPGAPLSPGALYDSNGPMLSALLTALGCEVTRVLRVGDDLDDTIAALRTASEGADLVVTSGGVSVGEEDHVKAAVRALGSIEVWKVAVQPGKPIGFGRVAGVPWLGLPGNPLSGFVTALVFGVPLLRRLQGREPLLPVVIPVAAGFSRPLPNAREEYVRVAVQEGRLVPHPKQGSGVLSSASWGDGLARIPADTIVREGDLLDFTGFAEYVGEGGAAT